MGEEKACCDRIFSVATGLAARWLLGCRDLGFWVAKRPGWWDVVATKRAVLMAAHLVCATVRALCTRPDCYIVLCCALC